MLRDGRVQKEIPHVRSGTHTIRYVDVGTIKLRFIEDLNGNGKWDTGNYLKHLQPEEIKYLPAEIKLKKNLLHQKDLDFFVRMPVSGKT